MASSIKLFARDTAAVRRGQLLARLKWAGVEVVANETIEVERGSIYARGARKWRSGELIRMLHVRRTFARLRTFCRLMLALEA